MDKNSKASQPGGWLIRKYFVLTPCPHQLWNHIASCPTRQGVPGVSGVGCDADRSPLFSAMVKNTCSYASTPRALLWCDN
jgi:hypothetical protein